MTLHSQPRALPHEITRRHALTGAATVGLALPLLAACGDDESPSATDPGAESSDATPTKPAGSSSSDGGAAEGLVAASEVEVGGGVVLADQDVVITQPTEGEFKGFSATCTHQGCKVAEVVDGQIHCPCHDSMFSIEDGSPLGGPATVALGEVPLTVQGGQISLA